MPMLKLKTRFIFPFLMALPQASQACSVSELSFLIGTWDGTGIYKAADGTESHFQSSETIRPALNGKILQMEGLQTSGSQVINHALTTIATDSKSGACIFDAYVDPG